MSTRLVLAIQEHINRLSPSERKLAQLLLDREHDMLTFSATELAEMAGVSKATAARLFRSLGYKDFNEVRLQAREERNLAPPFQPTLAAEQAPARPASIAGHLGLELTSLTQTFESLRSDTLSETAGLLARANRIWLLGLGMDEGLVRYVRPLLARIRPDVFILGAQNGVLAEDLAMTGSRDVLLIVATQPPGPVIEQVISYVATTRLDVVSIADVREAAWARRVSRVVLPCFGNAASEALSSAAVASMLHLLCLAVAERIGKQATQRAALIADIHDGFTAG